MSTRADVRAGLEQPAVVRRRFGALLGTFAALIVGVGLGLFIGHASLEEFSPMMVFDDRIVFTGRVGSVGVRWLSVLHFTGTGDVKIISETLYLDRVPWGGGSRSVTLGS